MYNYAVHTHINDLLKKNKIAVAGKDNAFYTRMIANASNIYELYMQLYAGHPKGTEAFDKLIQTIINAYKNRPACFKRKR